jgi:uncharacterized protein
MDRDLENLKKQIISLVNPLRIILFGSRSKGTFSETSDYDLMIIMPEGTNKRETAQFLYKNIENIKKSYDLIVTTQSILQKYRGSRHLIYFHALKDGQELYAA